MHLVKPKLTKQLSKWKCSCGWFTGIGKTPIQAYQNYRREVNEAYR